MNKIFPKLLADTLLIQKIVEKRERNFDIEETPQILSKLFHGNSTARWFLFTTMLSKTIDEVSKLAMLWEFWLIEIPRIFF